MWQKSLSFVKVKKIYKIIYSQQQNTVTAYIANKAKHKGKAASCVIKKGGFYPLFFFGDSMWDLSWLYTEILSCGVGQL